MPAYTTAARAAAGWTAAVMLTAALTACGGGGGDAAPPAPPPPTPLPTTLQLQTPVVNSALGVAHAFGSNAADPSRKLSYRWDFGDGTVSTEATPTHSYTRAGHYTVKLTLTNETGATVTSEQQVSIADLALVAGKVCSGPGWCWQRPLPIGDTVLDHVFVDGQRGWAVGENGSLLSTTDGGATWTVRHSGTDLTLSKVVFADANHGWVVGSSGHLLRTTDGGTTWTLGTLGRGDGVYSIKAHGPQQLSVNGPGGYAYSTDGGVTWQRPTPNYYGYWIANGALNDFWETTGGPLLRHSTDGGVTWQDVKVLDIEPGLNRYFQSVHFVNATHGWVRFEDWGWDLATQTYISRKQLLRTTDAGVNWQPYADPWEGAWYSGNPPQFLDAKVGYAVGPYSVRRTTDGGDTWTDLVLPVNAGMQSARVYTAEAIAVVDYAGRRLFSGDGGATWAVRNTIGAPTGASVRGVWFFDSRSGVALGDDGKTVRTTDGGQTWVAGPPSPAWGGRALQFLADGSIGWMLTGNGNVMQSTDRGFTWTQPGGSHFDTLSGALDFHFVDALRGWAVVHSWYGHAIVRTVDGGASWLPQGTGMGMSDLRAIRFVDANHGVAVGGPGVVWVTADGGATWQARPSGSDRGLAKLAIVDAQTLVAVGEGGQIVRSTDRGLTWTRAASPTATPLADVRFASATHGWAVGDAGTLLHTADGGLTWVVQATGTRVPLMSAFFLDEQTGWVTGGNGSILVTATGGR